MQLHDLKSNGRRQRSQKIGRGGKRGTTAGRGTKGQRARAGHRIRPELRDLIKKLPKRRGHGKNINTSRQVKPVTISWDRLIGRFTAGEKVTPASLQAKGLINGRSKRLPVVKILAGKKEAPSVTIEGCLMSDHVRTTLAKN